MKGKREKITRIILYKTYVSDKEKSIEICT